MGPEGVGCAPRRRRESAPENTRGMMHWVAHAAGFLQVCGASGRSARTSRRIASCANGRVRRRARLHGLCEADPGFATAVTK
jgi:hypothetical protein